MDIDYLARERERAVGIGTKLVDVPCGHGKFFFERRSPEFGRPELIRDAISIVADLVHQQRQLTAFPGALIPFFDSSLQLFSKRIALAAQVVALFFYGVDLGAQILKHGSPLLQQQLELRQLRAGLLELGAFLTCGWLWFFQGR